MASTVLLQSGMLVFAAVKVVPLCMSVAGPAVPAVPCCLRTPVPKRHTRMHMGLPALSRACQAAGSIVHPPTRDRTHYSTATAAAGCRRGSNCRRVSCGTGGPPPSMALPPAPPAAHARTSPRSGEARWLACLHSVKSGAWRARRPVPPHRTVICHLSTQWCRRGRACRQSHRRIRCCADLCTRLGVYLPLTSPSATSLAATRNRPRWGSCCTRHGQPAKYWDSGWAVSPWAMVATQGARYGVVRVPRRTAFVVWRGRVAIGDPWVPKFNILICAARRARGSMGRQHLVWHSWQAAGAWGPN